MQATSAFANRKNEMIKQKEHLKQKKHIEEKKLIGPSANKAQPNSSFGV